ncbi:MAG TPA: hypothetical protein VFF64_10845 [Candidatus Eremiobacteraceae bacterium]|nr:hypothetical protein [Candidatus Eremiobacteraceae bacterium]
MSKTAAVVLALLTLMLFPTASRAQLIQSGNVYAGVAYADSVDVINRLTFRGFDGSVEVKPFLRFSYLGFVLDGSGIYRPGVVQYNAVLGPRVSKNYGKWRIFAHVTAGEQLTKTGGESFNTVIEDAGAGADRRIPFKRFSWRLQLDVVHSHLLNANQYDVRGSTGLVWRF